MRIALVTPAEGGAAATTRALLPHLRSAAEVELFVEPSRAGEGPGGERLRSLVELTPRSYDQLLYALGNERPCGFMLPAIRALGGTVALLEWNLAQAAHGAYASLERGGWRGWGRALAEGGLGQARLWSSRLRAGPGAGPPPEPALNRSAVRFGDAFLVDQVGLAERILAERNERTPIALVPRARAEGGAGDAGDWAAAARAWLEALEGFPHARSARRSLVALAFRARAAARSARATPEPT